MTVAPIATPAFDPRPDLEEDHDLWVTLLSRVAAARGTDDPDGLYWALRGARAIGAELSHAEDGGLRLRPRPDGEADYAAVRMHLVRHRDALSTLLAES